MKQKLLILSVVLLAVMVTAIPALAAAPAVGTVVEGESVPGITLGDTRAQVEAANGSPSSCRSNNDPPTMESCSFDVVDGGWVSVFYQGPDGGDATGSDSDVVSNIHWGGEEVDGWETTAGINTKLAKYDKQAAMVLLEEMGTLRSRSAIKPDPGTTESRLPMCPRMVLSGMTTDASWLVRSQNLNKSLG